jgi:hypothetical protein
MIKVVHNLPMLLKGQERASASSLKCWNPVPVPVVAMRGALSAAGAEWGQAWQRRIFDHPDQASRSIIFVEVTNQKPLNE